MQLTRENSSLRERLRATEAACEQRGAELQAATREKVDTLLLLSQTEERHTVERDSVDTLQQRNSILRERLLQVSEGLNAYVRFISCFGVSNRARKRQWDSCARVEQDDVAQECGVGWKIVCLFMQLAESKKDSLIDLARSQAERNTMCVTVRECACARRPPCAQMDCV